MWKWMDLFLRKNHLLSCWGWLSLLNWIETLTLALLLKVSQRKLKLLLVLWSFFLLCLHCISINLSYDYAWNTIVMSAGAPSCFLELLDQLKDWICRPVGSLAYCWNAASLSLFLWQYFDRCWCELTQLALLLYTWGRSTRYSHWFHNFSVTIPRSYIDVYVNSFFPCTTRLWNSVSVECFPLTYDRSDFKSRINRHLLTVGSF